MGDYIGDDLDHKKNEENYPVWQGIILPGHYYKSVVH
jgi:hypothetical protein